MSIDALTRAVSRMADKRSARTMEKARNDFGTVLDTDPLTVEIQGAGLTLREEDLHFMGISPARLERDDALYVSAVGGEYVVGGRISKTPLGFGAGTVAGDVIAPEGVVRGSLEERIQQSLWEPGDIKQTARPTVPVGWLPCNGGLALRAQFPELFEAIGTAHGAGDGSTTFKLPDAQGRQLVGRGQHPDVSAIGKSDSVAFADRTPLHQHTTVSHVHGQPAHSHSAGGHSHGQNTRGSGSGSTSVASAGETQSEYLSTYEAGGNNTYGGGGGLLVGPASAGFLVVTTIIKT